jgi:hypothetical protein
MPAIEANIMVLATVVAGQSTVNTTLLRGNHYNTIKIITTLYRQNIMLLQTCIEPMSTCISHVTPTSFDDGGPRVRRWLG